ncbi:MAG: diadenylate cyclase CdaA [Candidatus Omnitrophica bacterium]|nr:diadenylate cyclase CdaA [Candidatus Omnitrophota bacterium]MDD5487430.1 diadenylate cyclase CdaA [Candidatus Omnitrophota bacterium]
MELFFVSWEMILEISILWGVYYLVYLLLKGTAAEQVLKGVIIISAVIMLTRGLNLVIINWLLTRLLAISVLAFLIIFQPEIRRGLARIGRFGIFAEEREILGEIAKASVVLSKKKTGGLIAIEREIGLRRYVESGVSIDSRVTSELINTIFTPTTPLHDGGIIISEQRLEAAACLFPLTQNPNVPKTMGTRHRAALGLSEETDAAIIVISEETGKISLAMGGKITEDLDHKNIARILEKAYMPRVRKSSVLSVIKKILSKKEDAQGMA